MDILILTVGFIFLWHVLLFKVLPFLSGMIGGEDGCSIYLLVISLLPISYLLYTAYEKYGKLESSISIILSFSVVAASIKPTKNLISIITLN